jgi:curved DNA-binding protein CbpA
MTEASHAGETPSDEGNHRLYAVLNVPRTANVSHIERNFKQLSRVYHPDKSVAEKRAVAQQSFVTIKTAAEVLSDPVYRVAYDYGGMIAVTLVKRSQSAQHSQKAVAEAKDEDEENNEFVDLYSTLEQAVDEQEAASIIHHFVEEYRMHHQNISKAHFDVSCEIPYVYRNSGLDQPFFQRNLATVNFHSRCPLSSKVSASIGSGSELQRTAEANINASFGLDYQPVRGTHVTADAVFNHHTAPVLSVRTSRQSAAGTVMVAAIGGNVQSSKTWNATLISSKPILWESLSGQTTTSKGPTKLMATWRIAFNPAGQLRFLMAGLRTLEFPVWGCRVCLGTYPVKISWRGAETDTFYATYSWGMMFSRVKLLRISSLGSKWTFKFGLKYDGQALYTGNSLWSVVCQFQSSELSLRIPICLDTVSPVAWCAALLFAEFVDLHIEKFQSNIRKSKDTSTDERTQSAISPARKDKDVIRKVALKKRNYESSKQDGLVIIEARWQSANNKHDVTDILQFWVVDSQLHLHMNDSRLWWQLEQQSAQPVEEISRTWWESLFGTEEVSPSNENNASVLTTRYQFKNSVYEVSFEGEDVIQLPNLNATELGPTDRVR